MKVSSEYLTYFKMNFRIPEISIALCCCSNPNRESKSAVYMFLSILKHTVVPFPLHRNLEITVYKSHKHLYK